MTPFYIQSLHLKNCGPIQDMVLDFRSKDGSILQTVVIGGANGSGKTTVLEMIVEIIGSLFYRFSEGEAIIPIELGRIYRKNDLSKIEYTIGNEIYSFSPQNIDNFLFMVGDTLSMIREIYKSTINKQNVLQNKNTLPPSILFFPHTRYIPKLKGEQLFKVEPTYQFIYKYENISHFKDSYDAFFTWLDYAEPAMCEEILGFVNGIDFNGKKFFIDRKNLQIKVQTANNETHPLAEMSSGEQNIFILLLELQLRLTPYSIVLIDEIENSLHPAYQQLLAYSLTELQKKTPFQLIVTTHSKEFIKFFGADKVRYITTL